MDIKRFLNALARKWWLIIIFALVCGGGAGYISYSSSIPMYQAESTLYIINRDNITATGGRLSVDNLVTSQQLIADFNDLIHRQSFIASVLQNLKSVKVSAGDVNSMLRLETRKESNVLKIIAVWTNTKVCAAVVNAVGAEMKNQVKLLTGSDYVNILDEASVSNSPLPVTHTRDTLIGVLFGLVLALAVIYIIEYFDTTVRSVDDVEQILSLRVVGIIPEYDIR